MTHQTRRQWMLIVFTLCGLAVASAVVAQTPPPADTQPTAEKEAERGPDTFFGILFSGGPMGIVIMLALFGISFWALALVIEQSLAIRSAVLVPSGLAEQVQSQLLAGHTAQADALCRARPSFLAFVLQAGIAEVDGGWNAVEKAMEDAAAEQSARLLRRVEYLSVIGNIAPMLGLLGTVAGMILAFREVAMSQGAARASQLAGGIYSALVTTVAGLVVAIPALAAFAVFRNRVDQLVAEGSYVAQHVFLPLKRRRKEHRREAATATPPAPPPKVAPHQPEGQV